MKVDFQRGFMEYNFGNNKDFLFVAVHPTTDLEFSPRNDVGADLLCVQAAKRMGCRAVITTMPRNREFGMDLNRLPPSAKDATEMFKYFLDDDFAKTKRFDDVYSWVSADRKGHGEKMRVYRRFWSRVNSMCSTGTIPVFVHVQGTKLRNFPSLMDIIPLSGFDTKDVREVVREMNRRNAKLFESLKGDLTEFMVFHHKTHYKWAMMNKFGSTDPKKMVGNSKALHRKTLRRVLSLGFKREHKTMTDNYSFSGHTKVIRKIGRSVRPEVTYMKNFSGKYALGTKKEMKGKRVMEIEFSTFLSELRTDLGIELLEQFLCMLD